MLRDRIRIDTRHEHEKLDQFVSHLNLSTNIGLGTFLKSQLGAYSVIYSQLPNPPKYIKHRSRLALSDLNALGITIEGSKLNYALGPVDPMGVRYVVEGSHLGGRFIRKIWAQSENQRVKAAGTFLSDESLATPWKETLETLKAMDSETKQADSIVKSAIRCFELFQTSFKQNVERYSDN